MLEFKGVSRDFRGPDGEVGAVRDVSLAVEKGEMVAVQGSSGCGKTTLLLMAGALLRPSQGEILIGGENPYELAANKRSMLRARKVGFVFQQFHLVPYLSVLDNVLSPSIAVRQEKVRDRALELIGHFKLEHRIRYVPAQLSTGERQRTALARALLNRPDIILADEPTGNLDDENAGLVFGYMKEFANDGGEVLIVTHDARVVDYVSRQLQMREGRVSG